MNRILEMALARIQPLAHVNIDDLLIALLMNDKAALADLRVRVRRIIKAKEKLEQIHEEKGQEECLRQIRTLTPAQLRGDEKW